MSDLHISLLGTFQASLAGRKLDSFRTRKVQALFVYLLVQTLEQPDTKHRREQLITLFWPHKRPQSGRRNLRQILYLLRKTIPEVAGTDGEMVPLFLSDRQHIWVNSEASYELDVASFLSLVEQGSEGQLVQAVALYSGDFLQDFYLKDSSTFETWAASWRSRLRRLALEALDKLASQYLQKGDFAQAERYARRQLEIDNLHESAYRHAILALNNMGRRSKALSLYQAYRRHLEQKLDVAPSAEIKAIAHAVREGKETTEEFIDQRARSPLPVPDASIVGRDSELAYLKTLLRNEARLISIVGPGGVGKTRLALEAAHQHTGSAVFVNLAAAADVEDLLALLIRALGIESDQAGQKRVKQQLLDYLQNKRLLMALDNFEHLLPATSVIQEILQAAPDVRLLVTSRERLKLQAEHLFSLSGLPYSNWKTVAEAQESAAVQLFLRYAQRVRPSFVLQSEHITALYDIVRLTDGMPLAIILAAGWLHVLSPQEIASEINESLDFLAATHNDLPPRHQSMRVLFETTWNRLSKPEQRLLAALSVFRNGFTRSAAQAVADATPRDLLRLVDHALLTRLPSGRFEMHTLLQQFAAEKLDVAGMAKAIHAAHSDYYLKFLVSQLPDLKGRDQLKALDLIETDFDNLRAAWRWARLHGQWQILDRVSPVLVIFTITRSRFRDGIALFETAYRTMSDADEDATAYSYLLASRAAVLGYAGSCAEALAATDELNRIVDAAADVAAVAYVQSALGIIYGACGHLTKSIEILRNVFTLYQEVDEPYFAALMAIWLAWGLAQSGKPKEALVVNRKGLALARRGETSNVASALLYGIGAIIRALDGPTDECERCLWEAVTLRREVGERRQYAVILAQAANLPLWRHGDVSSPLPGLMEAWRIVEDQALFEARAYVLIEMTTHRLVERDYQEALALSSEALSLVQNDADPWARASMQHGIALLALGSIEEGLTFMKRGLRRMRELHWPSFIRSYLPFLGVYYNQRGEHERAVELMAIGFDQRYTGRLDIDPQLAQLRSEMQATLGDERFAIAWTRGKAQRVLSVASAILRER